MLFHPPDLSHQLIADAEQQRAGYDTERADNPCERCESTCEHCRRYHEGDRIELSPVGVLVLGHRMVGRGTVEGEVVRGRKLRVLYLRVHWDETPRHMVAQVLPRHVQALYSANRAFI